MLKKTSVTSLASKKLGGQVTVPADKSISQRALIMALLARGITKIENILQSQDVENALNCIVKLGARIKNRQNNILEIEGRGVGLIAQPDEALYFGNSGTAARLMLGVLASHNIVTKIDGDNSLRARPMDRVLKPLVQLGAKFTPTKNLQDSSSNTAQADDLKLPITVYGTQMPLPLEYKITLPSAQVKSALLFAALNLPGISHIIETKPTRDHSEKMLQDFQADITQKYDQHNHKHIYIKGYRQLKNCHVKVPSDPSSAAFIIAAALITAESEITLKDVLLNPHRIGFIKVLKKMNADISIKNVRKQNSEDIGDITAKSSKLQSVTLKDQDTAATIDEYPILAVVAACAQGKTRFEGIKELRFKESDRIKAITNGLNDCNIKCISTDDYLEIYPTTNPIQTDKHKIIRTYSDHRIAMSFLVLGLASENSVTIDEAASIETSFPDFIGTMQKIGANIETN